MPDRSLEVSRVGQYIGNYRLIRRLGKGGFAEVYLGQHLHLPRQTAIKLLLNSSLSPSMLIYLLSEKCIRRDYAYM